MRSDIIAEIERTERFINEVDGRHPLDGAYLRGLQFALEKYDEEECH